MYNNNNINMKREILSIGYVATFGFEMLRYKKLCFQNLVVYLCVSNYYYSILLERRIALIQRKTQDNRITFTNMNKISSFGL